MHEAIAASHDSLSANDSIRIPYKDGSWILLSLLPVQPEPANLLALHVWMLERWPTTSLLDVFKEAGLRIEFTDVFRSATALEHLDRGLI